MHGGAVQPGDASGRRLSLGACVIASHKPYPTIPCVDVICSVPAAKEMVANKMVQLIVSAAHSNNRDTIDAMLPHCSSCKDGRIKAARTQLVQKRIELVKRQQR